MTDALQNLIESVAEEIAHRVEDRMKAALEKMVRENIKPIYSEEEAAADYFGVSIETLQSWRRRKLIGYSQLPLAKPRNGQEDGDLGNTYIYPLESLVEFQQKYFIPAIGKGNVVRMRRTG